jgi:hypothetical protein
MAISIGLVICGIAIGVAVNVADSSSSGDHIVIQAFDQNPTGIESNRYEWVMLYNPTNRSVNISGWTFSSRCWGGTNTTIPKNTTIHPNKYLTFIPDKHWLHDEDEPIILSDTEGNTIDKTPAVSDRYNDDRFWQRHPVGFDTDSDSDWMFGLQTLENGGMRKKTVKYVYDGEIHISPISSETEILSYANGTTVNLEILRNGSGKSLIIIPSEFVPYANFKYTPLNPVVNQSITFDAAASWTFDPNAAIKSYEWCFGDGKNGTGQIVNHTYPLPGNYIVCLEVTDSDGEETRCNARYMVITVALTET